MLQTWWKKPDFLLKVGDGRNRFGLGVSHLCLSYFSDAMAKHHDQGNLEKKATNPGPRMAEPVIILVGSMAAGSESWCWSSSREFVSCLLVGDREKELTGKGMGLLKL